MQNAQLHIPHLIGDTLDRAVALYRTDLRAIGSQFFTVQCINLALLSLLFAFLGSAPATAALWRIPLYIGNPFTLFDAIFRAQANVPLHFAGVLVSDLVLVLPCVQVLLIPRFARPYQPDQNLHTRSPRFIQGILALLVPNSGLLFLCASEVLLVRSIVPFNPLAVVMLSPPLLPLLIQLLLASCVIGLAGPLVYGRFALAPQVSLLEHCGGWRSLIRSWQLTRTVWRQICGLTLVTNGLLATVLILPATLPLLDRVTPLRIGQLNALIGFSIFALTMLALVIVPFQIAASTILYYEVCHRIEGIDLERRVKANTVILTTEPGDHGGT